MKRVAVIGDVFADLVTYVRSYPPEGEGTYGTPLERFGGGCGGNIACGMGVLGLDTYMLCRLGNDDNGRFLMEDLERFGVKTDGIPLDTEYRSGHTVIAVDPEGERTIWVLATGSAYEKITPEDLGYLDKIQPDAIFVSGILLGVHPAEDSIFQVVPKWKGKSTIYFDPNLRYPADSLPEGLAESMNRMSDLSDVVFAGKGEREALGLKPRKGQKFIEKYGKQGSALLDENGNKVISVKATSHKAVDATGAGDTYAAAFVYADLNGMETGEAMKFASAAAGFCVTKEGARNTPDVKTVMDYLERHGDEL
ncbi:MAG: carbohydrate kinase family protein [Oscillospiraceae bacterium]|jgi:ribokinase